MYLEYKSDIEFCTKIHRKYGKSFYFGTFLMTKEYREAICVLYAFFRLPDEYVDTQHKDEKDVALEKLNHWRDSWDKCFKGESFDVQEDELKVLRASKYVFDKYKIPFEYSEAFILAMIQDTHKSEYKTYEELEEYMYGSASVVGLMMVYIICSKDEKFIKDFNYRNTILEYAKALGEAFQMTNFLRDISEDLIQRDRIYLPLEDLQKFNITKDDLNSKKVKIDFVKLMDFEIKRTNELYKKADIGIGFLPRREARAIKIARVIYSKILDKIELAEYDIFSSRVHLSFVEKIKVASLTIIKKI